MKKLKMFLKKLITISMCLIISFYTMFGSLFIVKAEGSYIARTVSDVNVRSAPTTDNNPDGSSNVIGEIDSGTIVTVVNTEKIVATGCSVGWVNISYKELNGYVCSRLIVDATVDAYDRPWTTPKKAIVGGAKFIAASYISKGQYTSYLKKFNVNPEAYYDQFSHQYMANLAAPASEAYTSYKTYSENKLFDLPLEFSIPVYSEMADAYNRPGTNLAEIAVQDEVTDEAFETELNNQGFPDSYKRILRALHTVHPNWVFKAMNTNVSFAVAVSAEKNVSSIQGGDIYYDFSTGKKILTEPGWYLANDETVAYYLDPRNFLTEQYILQFESLQNSANYTESVVQSVLNNTFMAEYSLLDNQTYASIFVEAANTANISAVYLASLAKQESGTEVRSTTSGAPFTYNNIEYSGLFNFFNIGAYSSEANPAKAGLVYASGGYCTICSADTVPDIQVPEINEPGSEDVVVEDPKVALTKIGATVKNGYLIGFKEGTKSSSLHDIDNRVSFNTEIIGTGTIATLSNGEQFKMVVYGDLDGNTEIDILDLVALKQHLLAAKLCEDVYLEAADVDQNGEVDVVDLVVLKQYIMNKSV